LQRLGDDVPLILAGRAYPAHDLVAELLSRVVERVSAWQDGDPAHLAISHPAPWGEYRGLLLRRAWWEPVTLVPRPVAAVVSVGRAKGTIGVVSPECFAVVRDGELLACHEPSGFADLTRDSVRRLAGAHELDDLIEDEQTQPAAGAVLIATEGVAPQPVHNPTGWRPADRPPRPPVSVTSLNLPRRKRSRTLQLGRH
jgi:hypothetical protein